MAKLYVNKSIVINTPIEKVFTTLNNFNHWHPWSPWLIQEPEAVVTVSDDAKYYEWKGNRTGQGNMQITKENENKSIDIDLTFLKPWKSKAKVGFEFTSKGEGTEVTWTMDSSLPFFLFFLKKITNIFIGMDYERGLKMLKDYIEDGEVHSKLDFKGISEYEGCDYIGINTSCSMVDMPQRMEDDFKQLKELVQKDNTTSPPFTIYHKWKVVKQQVNYTVGVPVKNIPNNLPNGIISGIIPKTKTYKLSHQGPYEHLGNAWTTMYNMQRAKVFKLNKKINPFEIYVSDPDKVAQNDLITEINFAIK